MGSDFEGSNDYRREKAKRRQSSLVNVTKRMKLEDRVYFVNEGTIILDDKITYYSKKKVAKVKGRDTRYTMRGIQHFFDVFAKRTSNS